MATSMLAYNFSSIGGAAVSIASDSGASSGGEATLIMALVVANAFWAYMAYDSVRGVLARSPSAWIAGAWVSGAMFLLTLTLTALTVLAQIQ